MSNTVIKVENISKQYRLGNVGLGTIGADFNRWYQTSLRGREDPYLKIGDTNDRAVKGNSDYVWALRNINFEVKQGEVLGIIGRNGAGKSTLLKILSRTTTPTTGQIKIKGRVASLLEVGTGFHPELTGRENIFLNGAILGMTKKEINSKFDEIVDFAGVERYIDTPVKRYSSGMYVRLAFGVAAHLEPEILIVDEVLAVGDAEFQKKALGKMKDVSGKEGRTVLFVSHNMAAIKSLCHRAILLENGFLKLDSTVENVVSDYLGGKRSEGSCIKVFGNDYDSPVFRLNEINLKNFGMNIEAPLVEDKEIELTTSILFHNNDAQRYQITYHLYNEMGEAMFSFYNKDENQILKQGDNIVKCFFPCQFFQAGNFSLALFVVEDKRKVIFHQRDIISFTITDGAREIGVYMGKEPGYITPNFKWSINQN